MDKRQLREMIDACRPGEADLGDPEMAPLAERLAGDPEAQAAWEKSQRLDSALRSAFRDVPVPGDLQQRLLEAVAASSGEGDSLLSSAVSEAAAEDATREGPSCDKSPSHEDAASSRPISRRRFWATAGALAATVLLAVGGVGYYYWAGERTLSRARLVKQTQLWLEEAQRADASSWRPISDEAFRYFPSRTMAASPTHWRFLKTGLDREARMFRIPLRGQTAYLLVLRSAASVENGSSAPPQTPFPEASGGWEIGAWSRDGYLFVLAVERGPVRYRDLTLSPETA